MKLNDLKPTKANSGAEMQLIDPSTDEPIPGWTITLLGIDSDVYQDIQRRKQQTYLDRAAKGKKAGNLDAKKLASDSLEELVACTVGWTGLSLDGEEPLEFSADNARMVYEQWSWIKEQAQAFVNDRANFFAKS